MCLCHHNIILYCNFFLFFHPTHCIILSPMAYPYFIPFLILYYYPMSCTHHHYSSITIHPHLICTPLLLLIINWCVDMYAHHSFSCHHLSSSPCYHQLPLYYYSTRPTICTSSFPNLDIIIILLQWLSICMGGYTYTHMYRQMKWKNSERTSSASEWVSVQ
jgi:hypothetical protein